MSGILTTNNTNLRAPLVFDGTGDVRLFFYRYERSVGKTLNEVEKAETLIDHLEGVPLEFYCKKFLTNYSKYSGHPYPKVKSTIVAKYQPEQQAAELASAAVDFRYDGGDIREFMERADQLYTEAKFTAEASFGLLKRAIRDTPFPSHLFAGVTPTSYEALKKEILRVHSHVREYGLGIPKVDTPRAKTTPTPEVMETPISPPPQPATPTAATKAEPTDVAEIRSMFDNLSLLLKQSRTSQGQGQRFTRPCGHCNEIGHIMSRCPKNPHRNTYCGYCGRLGHNVANCYSRARNPTPGGFRPGQGPRSSQTPAPQTPQENTAALVIAP